MRPAEYRGVHRKSPFRRSFGWSTMRAEGLRLGLEMGALCEMIGGITRVGRFSVLLGVLLAAPVAGASAQDAQWWESIPGFGKQGSSYRTASEERRKPEQLNDLRA